MHKSLSQCSQIVDAAKTRVHIGTKYRHYKSTDPDQQYQVTNIAILEATEEPVVVYQALYGDQLTWVRPIDSFCETVVVDGKSVKRFEEVI